MSQTVRVSVTLELVDGQLVPVTRPIEVDGQGEDGGAISNEVVQVRFSNISCSVSLNNSCLRI